MQMVREIAIDIGLTMSRAEISGIIARAEGRNFILPDPKKGGDFLNVVPQPFLWDGIIMSGRQNLLVAPPKVGKSALMVALAGASIRCQKSFLGLDIKQHINKLIIVGTDQNESDWWTLLKREGLGSDFIDESGSLKHVLHEKVLLWSLEDRLQLNDEGSEAICGQAICNPGSLILIDTYHACMGLLGIEESSSEFDIPARQLEQALAGTNSTTVLIHHTNKSVSGGNPITASRGNNSLAAAVSWSVLLNWLNVPAEGQLQVDHRIAVKPMGRGQAQSLVIELNDAGWVSHGAGDAAFALEAIENAEADLTEQLSKVYDCALMRWSNNLTTTAPLIANTYEWSQQKALRSLQQLVKRGLMTKKIQSGGALANAANRPGTAGRPAVEFRPVKPNDYEGTPENVCLMNEMTLNPPKTSLAHKKNHLSHFIHNKPPQEGTPLNHPCAGLPVERLINAGKPTECWQNGWIIDDASNLHAITISKIGQIHYKIKNMRWPVDIRPCERSPFESSESPNIEPTENSKPNKRKLRF